MWEIAHGGKGSVSLFGESFASIGRIYFFFAGGDGREGYRGVWAQRSNSMKFLEFPDIS